MQVEEFARIPPEGFRQWLLGKGEAVVGYAADGSSCPLATFAKELGCPEETRITARAAYDTDRLVYTEGGTPLPEWMTQFVSEVDADHRDVARKVTAPDALRALALVQRRLAITDTYKETAVQAALLGEMHGRPFKVWPLDAGRMEAQLGRCRFVIDLNTNPLGHTKRGRIAQVTAATWHMSMLDSFRHRLATMGAWEPGYRRLVAYQAAQLEYSCMLMGVVDDAKGGVEFWNAAGRTFTEIWLAASEPLLSRKES